MNFDDFSKHWIEDNIPVSTIYGNNISKFVKELCETIINQRHSGASFNVTANLFARLVRDYSEQYNDQA